MKFINLNQLRRRRRGMAIASVLLLMVVLLGMTGAFFTSHKADLSLMMTSTYREETKNATLSAAEFIEYKLQNDRLFGSEAFDGSRPAPETFPATGSPSLEVSYTGNGSDAEDNLVRGRLLATNSTFEAHILNNLDNAGPASDRWGETPGRTARVWIRSQRGRVTRQIDMIVRRSPFTKTSMLAGKDIDVQLTSSSNGKWWLGARQPSGNAVRANGSINGPEVLSATGKAVQFQPPAGMAGKLEPPYGIMQANHLNMQLNGVTTELQVGNSQLEQAESNISGALNPGAGNIKVPQLDADDLRVPNASYPLPADRVTFKTAVGPSGQPVHQLIADGVLLKQYEGINPGNRFHTWTNGTNSLAVFDLEMRTMTVPPDMELTSSNEFRLESVKPDGTLDESRQPTLILGNALEQGSSISAQKIDVEGSVGGKGALKAGDGGLYIRAKSSLSTTPDFGIALHSTQDVVLSKPEIASNDGLPVDWDAFKEGISEARRSTRTDLNRWTELDDDGQEQTASEFKRVDLAKPNEPEKFDPIWQDLTRDFPADQLAGDTLDEWMERGKPPVTGPDPDHNGPPPAPEIELEPEIPAGPGVDVEKYVRMREYLKSVKSGAPDKSWLDLGRGALTNQRDDDVAALVRNQISSYQVEAGQTSVEVNGIPTLQWNDLSDYLSGRNPFTRSYQTDMTFRGLVYAGRDFLFDSGQKGLRIEGALVAHGDIEISNATGARFIYNSELLENLFATDDEDTSVNLHRTFWSIH